MCCLVLKTVSFYEYCFRIINVHRLYPCTVLLECCVICCFCATHTIYLTLDMPSLRWNSLSICCLLFDILGEHTDPLLYSYCFRSIPECFSSSSLLHPVSLIWNGEASVWNRLWICYFRAWIDDIQCAAYVLCVCVWYGTPSNAQHMLPIHQTQANFSNWFFPGFVSIRG